jgi:hypothetical protein
MTHRARLVLIACLLFSLATATRAAEASPRRQLWLYYATNLLVDKNLDTARQIWTRAAAAGYSHVMLVDSKLSRLALMDKRYFDNVEKAKRLAGELKLTLIPALFSVGYSNDLLSQDPNLAEGLPVKDAPFVVKGNQATLRPDPAVDFKAKFDYVDPGITYDGKARTATVPAHDKNARLSQKFKLTPYRHYHVSVEIKTDDYTGKPEIKALSGDEQLNWTNLHVKRTQDWATEQITFNSLEHPDVTVMLGTWGGAKGRLQWRNWKLEEIGLLNVLRRPGAPLVVRQGDKTLEEGKDFEPVKDPKLGNVPFAGEYDVFHASPSIKTKNLSDGTQLRVSWYHPHIIYDGQVCCCLGEPELDDLLADQAKRVRQLFDAPGYMMEHDEFRVAGQDEACLKTGKTPGQLLADNARFCTKLLEGSTAYVWNDMFDPFHNAVKGPYYLVRGPWTDSWEGLDKGVVIMNWNFGKRDQSLKFFADRGHKQVVAGYYDHKPEQVKDWVASANKVDGVVGVMYTTWRNDYSQIAAFAKFARE